MKFRFQAACMIEADSIDHAMKKIANHLIRVVDDEDYDDTPILLGSINCGPCDD